jgi:hypothetical protein
MRQVDVGFRSKKLLNLPQRVLISGACHREKHHTRQSNRGDCAVLTERHSVLLNHGAARSEQVRISFNKFRLFSGNALLSVQVPSVIDNSPVSVGIQVSKSAQARYSHVVEEEENR